MGSSEVITRRALVVNSGGKPYSNIVAALSAACSVDIVSSLDEAVNRISKEKFDFVLSDISSFVPLEKALIAQQASTVLEAIDQGVCVVDRNGQVSWSNKHFGTLSEELRAKVADSCFELLESLHESDHDPAAMLRLRHFNLNVAEDQFHEVTAAPIMTSDDSVQQVAAIVSDVTASWRLRRKIDAIDSAGRELVKLDAQQLSKLDVTERLALLEEKIIRYTHDLMHFSNFAIYILDKRTNRLELLVNSDLPKERVEIELHATSEGNGICGYVAHTGRSYICLDVRNDMRYIQGIDEARSSLTVPLRLHDQILGVLNVESAEPSAFTEDDRQFAEIFGRYIAIALNTFDLLATEHATTRGQLANNVQSEISAPLNDIITDATTLMEDYIGHDDIRRRLSAICDNVVKVKKAVKEVAEPQGALLGFNKRDENLDPILAGKKLLIVDDEDAIRETISEVLTSYGCDVETARDGAEAICMIGERQYDAVLSDIKMPDKNGYDVFAAAKENDSTCPVILMTGFGYDPNHSIIRARREGLSAVLFKPFKVDQLIGEIRNALQSAKRS